MARRQLQDDVYNVESEHDYDPEDPDGDLAQLEHYKLHGNAPRLMLDPLLDMAEVMHSFTGDSIYG